jgi:hypothetical protein
MSSITTNRRKVQRGVQANAWQRKSKASVNPIRLFVAFVVVSVLIAAFLLSKALQASSKQEEPINRSGPAPLLKERALALPSKPALKLRGSGGSATKYVDYLMNLAQQPTGDLRKSLEQDDIFQVATLMESCPFINERPDWLPPAPSKKPSDPFVWYEHLSKAGGTSFCQLAMRNMPRQEVAPYYCMPRDEEFKPSDPDGRVGRWSNEKLGRYRASHGKIKLVSNEWQPFPSERLELSDVLLVTTVRDPMDRLLSAYHFWGILHNEQPVKPTLKEWLHRHVRRSTGKDPQDWDFAVHIGRYNFATWKFSNGTMPQGTSIGSMNEFPKAVALEDGSWMKPFGEAVQNLAKFDVVLILELMASHSKNMLTSSLGWNDFEKIHVVPSGNVENNHANVALSPSEYEVLWEANRFDMLLYHWIKAVHLVRLQCPTLV